MNKYCFIIVILLLMFSISCKKEEVVPDDEPVFVEPNKYLFLGHIYERYAENMDRIDKRVEQINMSEYDQVWLGGDICYETPSERATLIYLDSIFNLSSPSTHWALGGHDILYHHGLEHVELIQEFTNKESYYSYYKDNITYLVLNTNLNMVYSDGELCSKMEDQYYLIQSVCDTISSSSHLIVIGHNVVWYEFDENCMDYANMIQKKAFSCDSTQTFGNLIYPHFKEVQDRGIQVIMLAGDAGMWNEKYGEYQTDDGVFFLAVGLVNSKYYYEEEPGKEDRVIIFNHDIEKRTLEWEFEYLKNID